MTQIMLSYPVTLKALKITCHVKHIKCPATPPTSPNTYHPAIHNFLLLLTSHHISTSPCLYCDSSFSESGALSTCRLLPIFLQQLHSPRHTTVTSLALPQLASQEFCRQHCPAASLCKLHCHFQCNCPGNSENCFFQKFWSPAMASVARSRDNMQSWSTELTTSHLHYLERNISNMVISATQYRTGINTLDLS